MDEEERATTLFGFLWNCVRAYEKLDISDVHAEARMKLGQILHSGNEIVDGGWKQEDEATTLTAPSWDYSTTHRPRLRAAYVVLFIEARVSESSCASHIR